MTWKDDPRLGRLVTVNACSPRRRRPPHGRLACLLEAPWLGHSARRTLSAVPSAPRPSRTVPATTQTPSLTGDAWTQADGEQANGDRAPYRSIKILQSSVYDGSWSSHLTRRGIPPEEWLLPKRRSILVVWLKCFSPISHTNRLFIRFSSYRD